MKKTLNKILNDPDDPDNPFKDGKKLTKEDIKRIAKEKGLELTDEQIEEILKEQEAKDQILNDMLTDEVIE